MKTHLLAALVGLLSPMAGFGQTFDQYFDGADTSSQDAVIIHLDTAATNLWQIGPPQKAIFDFAATLPNAIVTDTIANYPINNVSRFEAKVRNTWGNWGILAVQWMQKLDTDSAQDGGIVEFSIDDGLTWENAHTNPYVYNFYGFDAVNMGPLHTGELGFHGLDSTWKNVWLCFDLSWMSSINDSIDFRFTFISDSISTSTVGNDKEGWIIDNLLAQLTTIHTINEVEQSEYMTVTPNPTDGVINITTKKLDEFHIIERMELLDVQGRVVKSWTTVPTKYFIDISDQPNGMYFLNVKTNIKSESFKILLEH